MLFQNAMLAKRSSVWAHSVAGAHAYERDVARINKVCVWLCCSNVNCFWAGATNQRTNQQKYKDTHTHTHTRHHSLEPGWRKKSTTSTKTLDANDFNVFAKYIMFSLFKQIDVSVFHVFFSSSSFAFSPLMRHTFAIHMPTVSVLCLRYSYYNITSKQIVGKCVTLQ